MIVTRIFEIGDWESYRETHNSLGAMCLPDREEKEGCL
jgi:hypothetical protein